MLLDRIVDVFLHLVIRSQDLFQPRRLEIIHEPGPKVVQRADDEVQKTVDYDLEIVVDAGMLPYVRPRLRSEHQPADDIRDRQTQISEWIAKAYMLSMLFLKV